MAYSDFNLDKVLKTFDLAYSEIVEIFTPIPELECSRLLTEVLQENLPVALGSNTEKSRSELIIAPILMEVRKLLDHRVSLFSGVDFTVDAERGLNGNCDFLISRSPELLIVKAPVIAIVEAKKENINLGLGQCIAEMLAAKIFNEREGNEITTIYGAVTTGDRWKFLKLEGKAISVEIGETFLSNLGKILGILVFGMSDRE
ncbi:hypothetical protein [Tychonema sp. BBK16]|uniref:hypothetical protein n=1 Tax=Tychonema sp. BBK16 TaxID=2699888 RepID=UPI001F1ABCF8|nr:hypothetical protein [Tychonema sp. BBK16]MCF6374001.1 hypothetical protein [Tychonema sp. BBK16]